jgi:hypothetical protein
LIAIAIAGWSSVGLAKTETVSEISAGGCNDAHECVVSFNREALTPDRLCQSSGLSALWLQGSGKYLIQCKSGDTAENNVVWIVDSNAKFFGRLNYGRFITRSAVEINPNLKIPDKFGSRSLCHPIDLIKLKASDFPLLDKRPAELKDAPYCYEMTYLKLADAKLVIDIGRGAETLGDSHHVVHSVSTRDRERLTRLVELLRHWHPQL